MKIISKISWSLLAITALLALLVSRTPIFAAVKISLLHRFLPPAKTYIEVTSKRTPTPTPESQPKQIEEKTKPTPALAKISEQEKPASVNSLPVEWNLAVPFTSQAPKKDWTMPFQEACEEASIIMLDAFFTERALDAESATAEILDILAWEKDNLFHWVDTNAEETAQIIREHYGYKNVRVEYDITIEDIKTEIAKGHPVIVPAAGRLLGNPYFTQPGPIYHMLVVRGWTRDGKMITNDPGTKRGDGHLYTEETLMNAIHDYNSGDILNGRRAMIVATP